MRKLIVSEFVALDGVMEAPGGEPTHPQSGWVMDFLSDEQNDYKLAEVLEAEALLVGRVTYEGFAGAWPEREGQFADKMNSMPKYVVSSTLTDPTWENTQVLAGDVTAAIKQLKEGDGGPILVAGSATLVHSLIRDGLVDEYRFMILSAASARSSVLPPRRSCRSRSRWPGGPTSYRCIRHRAPPNDASPAP